MSSGTDTVPPLELQGAAAPPVQENEYERQLYEALPKAHQAENADSVCEPIPQPSVVEYAKPVPEPDDDNNDDNSNNAEDEYEDLLGNGLLKKKIIEPGLGRESRPKFGGEVTIEVYGKLADGTTVDDHSRFTFVLGDGDVIQALDLGVALMEMNEKSILVTAPKFAYGERGRKPDVPANATIMYTIKVLSSTPPIQYEDMPVLERLLLADAKREKGNDQYVKQEYICAINSYSKALRIIDPDNGNYKEAPEGLQKLLECRVKCLNNVAACQLKLEAYDAAVKSCEQVIKYHSTNGKAFYRLGKAHKALGNVELAYSYLQKAAKYENSKAIQAELLILEEKKKEKFEEEKQIYRRMFGNLWQTPSTAGATGGAATNPSPQAPPQPAPQPAPEPTPEPTPIISGSPSPKTANANPDPLPFIGPKKPSKLILDPFYGLPKKEDNIKPEIKEPVKEKKEKKKPSPQAPPQPAPEPTPIISGSPSPKTANANPDSLPFIGPKKPSKLILDPFYGLPKKEDDIKPEIKEPVKEKKEKKKGGWSSWLRFGGAVVAAVVGYGVYHWFSY